MSKSMLINVVNEEESRIAIVSGGLLEELSVETSSHEQIEGNIYRGRIVKVIPSLEAAFLDYGRDRNGFLAVDDIDPSYFPSGRREISSLRVGQELMVQVRKGELGQKGAALTTYISIPGRYFVITPYVQKKGVSKKIQDEETRAQLREALEGAGLSEGVGYIARTAAEGRTKQELTRDASYLLRLWKRLQAEYQAAKGPCLLYQESDIVIRTIRDYFTPSIQEVWVDDRAIFEQVHSFFQAVMPWYQKRVKLYEQKAPLFSKHNLENQIASIYEKTVPLPSGGSIVIEQTEALVSIDVNSGKTTKGKDIEETALIANREAAEEAARQLRLRDMGGLVVLDFIDMRSAGHRTEVRKVLQKALKEDKARTDVGSISKFGLLELSRQRLKPPGSAGINVACPVCRGAGKVRNTESFALSVLRFVQGHLARSPGADRVLLGVPPDVEAILTNRKRRKMIEIEDDFRLLIDVFSEPALHVNQYYVEYRKDGNTQRVDTNIPESFPRGTLRTPKGLPAPAARAVRPNVYALFEDEGEPPEVPAEPPDVAATAPAPAAPAEGNGEPGRKKRRRRKRRKSGEEAPEGSAPRVAEAPAEPPPSSGEDEPEAPAAETSGETPKVLSASAKRRLRRKRKKVGVNGAPSDGETPHLETPVAEPAPPPAAPAPAEEAAQAPAMPPSHEEAAPARPARRRRRRKTPAAPGDAPAEAPSTPEAPVAEKAAEPPADEAAAKPAKARARRSPRRPRRRAEAEGEAPSGKGEPAD